MGVGGGAVMWPFEQIITSFVLMLQNLSRPPDLGPDWNETIQGTPRFFGPGSEPFKPSCDCPGADLRGRG